MSFKFKFEDENSDEFLFDYLQDYTNSTVIVIEEIMKYLNLNGIVSAKLNGIQILIGFENLDSIDERLEELNKKILQALENKFKGMEVK